LADLTHSALWKMGPPDVFTVSVYEGMSFESVGFGEVWGIFPGYVGKIIELCLTFLETCEETGYPPGN